VNADLTPPEEERTWVLDAYGCWCYRAGGAWVWLHQRPAYCDRGHWAGNVAGIATIDHSDSFPRYFMNLDRAKLEMAEWLDWRMACERRRP